MSPCTSRPRGPHGGAAAARRRWPVALAALLAPGLLLAAPEPEFAVEPLTPPPAEARAPLQPALEAGLRWLALFQDDMDDVYGGLPVLEARLGARLSERNFVYLGAGYGWANGDLLNDDPTFEGLESDLVVVPLELGQRWDLAPRPDFRVNLGWRLELAWVRETLPAGSGSAADQPLRESGWLRGFGVSVGPEWTLGHGRQAIGLEAGLVGSGGTVGGRYGRNTNLSGAWARVYLTARL